jgi:hypothetical protein
LSTAEAVVTKLAIVAIAMNPAAMSVRTHALRFFMFTLLCRAAPGRLQRWLAGHRLQVIQPPRDVNAGGRRHGPAVIPSPADPEKAVKSAGFAPIQRVNGLK